MEMSDRKQIFQSYHCSVAQIKYSGIFFVSYKTNYVKCIYYLLCICNVISVWVGRYEEDDRAVSAAGQTYLQLCYIQRPDHITHMCQLQSCQFQLSKLKSKFKVISMPHIGYVQIKNTLHSLNSHTGYLLTVDGLYASRSWRV